MNARLRNTSITFFLPALIGIVLAICGFHLHEILVAENDRLAALNRTIEWEKLSVSLPDNTLLFPPGKGQELATAQCMTCHSVDMISQQPRLTAREWRVVTGKMVHHFG